MIRSLPAWLLVPTATLLLGCAGDSTGPLPAWPADGQTLPLGRYNYVVTWPAGHGMDAGTRRGQLVVLQKSDPFMRVRWEVPSFNPEDQPTAWENDAYRLFIHSDIPINIEHRIWRPAGAERLECTARYTVPGMLEPAAAQCSVSLRSGL